MAELRDSLSADRHLRFRAIVDIPILLDREGCREAIALADTVAQLSDPNLLEHLRALPKADKMLLRQAYVARRRALNQTATMEEAR